MTTRVDILQAVAIISYVYRCRPGCRLSTIAKNEYGRLTWVMISSMRSGRSAAMPMTSFSAAFRSLSEFSYAGAGERDRRRPAIGSALSRVEFHPGEQLELVLAAAHVA